MRESVESPRQLMDRVVSALRTSPDWGDDERPQRTPFRRLARMSEGVSPGYTAILYGKQPLALFSHIVAFLAVPARMSIGVICIEQTPDAVMTEMISCVSGIPAGCMRQRFGATPIVRHTEHCSFSDS